MATNLYALLQNLTVIHPEIFKNHDFYIFGESYAGKYIPSIAYYILHWNGNTTTTGFNPIPLKGVGIGDGISDPIPQYTSYSDYGFAAGLIDEYEREIVEVFERQSVQYINKKDWSDANDAQNSALEEVVTAGGNVNVYNVRYFGDYNSTLMDTWLNLNTTKTMFHVPTSITFLDCGDPAYEALANDIPQSVAGLFPYLLNNTRVLLYEGQDDLILNMVGAETWISQLQWYGQTEYLTAPKEVWVVGGQVAGYARGYQSLTQLVVLKAGHMVPLDQLTNSVDMVNRFITNAPWGN
jgi:carboxypeptidase C (cathepsin A)